FLYEEIGKIAVTRTSAEWLADLDDKGIPSMIVNSLESLLTDPQLEATGFWHVVEHPSEGTLRLPGIPAKYGKTPGDTRLRPHPHRGAARGDPARDRPRRVGGRGTPRLGGNARRTDERSLARAKPISLRGTAVSRVDPRGSSAPVPHSGSVPTRARRRSPRYRELGRRSARPSGSSARAAGG